MLTLKSSAAVRIAVYDVSPVRPDARRRAERYLRRSRAAWLVLARHRRSWTRRSPDLVPRRSSHLVERPACAGQNGSWTCRGFASTQGSTLDTPRVPPRQRAPFDSDGVSGAFERAVAASGLPRFTLHGCRHKAASLMLQSGRNAKVVQERHGHSSIRVTLDIYASVMPGMDADAADRLGRPRRRSVLLVVVLGPEILERRVGVAEDLPLRVSGGAACRRDG